MFRSIPIFVKMFDDRIVSQSPGGFAPGVTPENIYEQHHPRNRIIMDALRETGEVRCINEGTKRVRSEMARANLPAPLFKEQRGESASVSATLFNNASARAAILSERALALVGDEIAATLAPEEAKILNHLAQAGRTTVTATMKFLGDARWHATSFKLDRLRRKGILRRVSSKARPDRLL
jgi:ATP-dependent DNA helicase RecG